MEYIVRTKATYAQTEREKTFLETVEETRHDREIVTGLSPFFNERAPEDMMSFYYCFDCVFLKST